MNSHRVAARIGAILWLLVAWVPAARADDAAVARESGGGNGRGAAAGAGKIGRLREAIAILAAPPTGRERTVALLELFARE